MLKVLIFDRTAIYRVCFACNNVFLSGFFFIDWREFLDIAFLTFAVGTLSLFLIVLDTSLFFAFL